MIKKEKDIAEKLVNSVINQINDRWASDLGGKCYLVRHTEDSNSECIMIQPTYSDTFFYITEFISVAEACGCSLYVTCRENLNGIMTPTLYIF